MTGKRPYLSVVIVVRNDNYGGEFDRRVELSLTHLVNSLEAYCLSSEIILVNYNPVRDRPGIDEAITLPTSRTFVCIRMLTVPTELHRQLLGTGKKKDVPVLEFIAKNIGIRRAKGEFILSTNADILFSDGLVGVLAKKQLKNRTLYRCDRYDFHLPRGIGYMSMSRGELEALVKCHVKRFYFQGGTFAFPLPLPLSVKLKILSAYNRFRKGYYKLLLHTPGDRFFLFFPKIRANQFFILQHHCNASGDMTLMDRKSWIRLRGYLEDTWISTHTDSLLMMSANAAGISQRVLADPVYHQHHTRRFDFNKVDGDMSKMYDRLLEESNRMLKTSIPLVNEHMNWGLGEELLPELRL